MMTAERERWVEALAVMNAHGDALYTFFADRLVELTKAGNMAGVERWLAILHRCEMLRRGTVH
jgi:hypothetical protein